MDTIESYGNKLGADVEKTSTSRNRPLSKRISTLGTLKSPSKQTEPSRIAEITTTTVPLWSKQSLITQKKGEDDDNQILEHTHSPMKAKNLSSLAVITAVNQE